MSALSANRQVSRGKLFGHIKKILTFSTYILTILIYCGIQSSVQIFTHRGVLIMKCTTVLTVEDKYPNRTRVRPCIPLNKLFLINTTRLWASNTILPFVTLWNNGKSIREIAKVLGSLEGTSSYTPVQVASRANNIMHQLEIRKRKRASNISKPAPNKPPKQKRRKCLMCQKKFTSRWIGERICKTCKQSRTWKFGHS